MSNEANKVIESPVGIAKIAAAVDPDFPTGNTGPTQADDDFLSKFDADDAAYGEDGEDGEIGEEAEETPEEHESPEPDDEPAKAESKGRKDEPALKEEAEQEGTYSGDDYEKALAAIRRDGLDPDSLRFGRKKLIEHGLKRAKFYGDQQETYRTQQEELKALKERAEKPKESSGPATPADEPLDLKGALEPFRAELGDESAAALQKALQAWHGSSTAENKALRERLEQTEIYVIASLYESARNRVRDRFPDVAKEDVWTKVVPKVRSWMEAGTYASLDDAITDAAKVMDLTDAQAVQRQEKDERADAAKRKGTPTGSGRRKAPASAKSQAELEEDLLADLEKAHGWDGD